MNKPYETTFIVDAHLSNEQIESTINKYSKFIADNGGSIILTDRWGKRRLAFEISKKQYGYYVYVRFDAEGGLIQTLEREYKLDDTIIRYLTLRVPKAIVAKESELKSKTAVAESGSVIPETDKAKEKTDKESTRASEPDIEDQEDNGSAKGSDSIEEQLDNKEGS